MSREVAMEQFVNKLTDLVPTFRPYVEALWADKLEKERLAYVEDVEQVCERQWESGRLRRWEYDFERAKKWKSKSGKVVKW